MYFKKEVALHFCVLHENNELTNTNNLDLTTPIL